MAEESEAYRDRVDRMLKQLTEIAPSAGFNSNLEAINTANNQQ
jgi:hypothetical protein